MKAIFVFTFHVNTVSLLVHLPASLNDEQWPFCRFHKVGVNSVIKAPFLGKLLGAFWILAGQKLFTRALIVNPINR